MKLISNSEQNFGQWARRLITMEKVAEWKDGVAISPKEAERTPGHYLFREKVKYNSVEMMSTPHC